MRALILPALLVALGACTQPPSAAERRPPPSDVCGASKFEGLIGQNRHVLDGMTLPEPARIIGPDMAVTRDYRRDRLNVEYDRNGVIQRISCY